MSVIHRYGIVLGVAAVAAASLLAHGVAQAKGGKSGGGRSGATRSGGWHSGAHYRGGDSARHRGGYAGHHSRVRVSGVFFGEPYFGARYGVYPWSEVRASAAEPVYYIEKTDGFWYYCGEAERYYPDVEQCASPWVPVQAWTATPAP